MQIPGIYVPIRGDYKALGKDLELARQKITEQSHQMSSDINAALSPGQIQKNVKALVGDLSKITQASSVVSDDFKKIGVDLGELRKHTGLSSEAFTELQQRMLQIHAANAQEGAFRRIAKAAQFSREEIASMGKQFGLSEDQIDRVTTSLAKTNKQLRTLGSNAASLPPIKTYTTLGQAGTTALNSQASSQVDSFANSLTAISGSGKAAHTAFDLLEVDMESLAAKTGLTTTQIATLKNKIANVAAEKNQEQAFASIAKSADLTEKEMRDLGAAMGVSATQIDKVVVAAGKAAPALQALSVTAVKGLSGNIDSTVASFASNITALSQGSKIAEASFNSLEREMAELRRSTKMTDEQFDSLKRKLSTNTAERMKVNALKSLARQANLTEREVKDLGKNFGLSGEQVKKVTDGLYNVGKATDSTAMKMRTMIATIGVYAIAFTAMAKIVEGFKKSIDFSAQIEIAQIGMASAFLTQGKYVEKITGKVLEGEAAFIRAEEEAAATVNKLKAANLETIATLDQLVKAYQVTLPVALAQGFDNDQIVKFTSAMVQAAGAIDDTGQLLNQLGEETRSLLTGNINPRTSRIATALGIRNEDIREYKGDVDGLFKFLMSKLSAYQAAGERLQSSWKGVWSNFFDIAQQATATAFDPLFEEVKVDLKDITDSLITVDEITGEVRFSDDFMGQLESMKSGINSIIAEFRRFSMLLDKVGGTMTAIGAFFTFGSWDDQMREWNKMLEERYNLQDKKLQEMANREAGLTRDGKSRTSGASKSDYAPNPKKDDKSATSLASNYNSALKAKLNYLKAEEAKRLAVIKSAHSEEQQLNDNAYSLGLISYRTYLDTRNRLTERDLELDLKSKQQNLENARKALKDLKPVTDKEGNARPDKDQKARYEALKRVEKAEKAAIESASKLRQAQVSGAHDVVTANRDVSRSYQELSIDLLTLTGQTIAAQEAQDALYLDSTEYLQLVQDAAEGSATAIQALIDVKKRMAVQDQLVALDHRESVLGDKLTAADITGDWENYYQTQVKILDVQIAQAKATGQQTEALETQRQEAEKMTSAIGAFEKGFGDVANEWADVAKNMAELGEDIAQSMHDSFSDLFFDALEGDFKDLSDYARSMLTSINRALADSLASGFLNSSGIGSLGNTMGSGLAGLVGMLFHDGGVVGADTTAARAVPAETFVGAPRYHTGLMPDEFPAILQRDETVFTPGQLKALVSGLSAPKDSGKSGSVSINIPVNIEGGADKQMVEELKQGVERTVMDIIRRHT